jgi:predicted O-methyltransferase YrrM
MKKGKPGQRMRWHAVIQRCSDARKGVEVGVFEGTLSAKLLDGIPNLYLVMVDRWSEYTQEQKDAIEKSRMSFRPQVYFDAAYDKAKAVHDSNPGCCEILRADSLTAAQHCGKEEFDFAFIDADHSYEGCKADIESWLPKVKKGGWMFFHDYGSKNHPGVKKAVDEMFDKVEVDADHVGAVQI